MSSATTDKISAKDISLGEFVTLLVLQLDEKGVPMPFQNEEKWHRLFYELKAGRQDLSEYLQSLHWNGFISVANPTYDRLSVDPDVKRLGDRARPTLEDKQLEQFLSDTISKASALFGGK